MEPRASISISFFHLGRQAPNTMFDFPFGSSQTIVLAKASIDFAETMVL